MELENKPRYDVSKECWIPVVKKNGERTELGLRDTLIQAHEIREAYTNSPVETIAINRLLLALSIHIFPATSGEKEWKQQLRSGCFDEIVIHTYFDEHSEKFDLFHPERPFYQYPMPKEEKIVGINKLFFEETSGNNATLFDHSFDNKRKYISLHQATRGLVAMQTFAVGGGVSKPFNLSHSTIISGGAVFWIRGNSLFEALLYNAPPTIKGRMEFSENTDSPTWDNPYSGEKSTDKKRRATSYLDYLTWQSRRLELVVRNVQGQWYAEGLKILQGDKIEPVPTNDPMMSYRTETTTKKGNTTTKVIPYKFKPENALWRDAHIFFQPLNTNQSSMPRVVEWLLNVDESADDVALPRDIDILGIYNPKGQAKVDFWRHERLPFYPKILTDNDRYHSLKTASDNMEKQAKQLQNAVKEFASMYLYSAHFDSKKGQQKDDTIADKNQKKDAEKLAASIAAERFYWSRLEVPFYEMLRQLGTSDMIQREELSEHWRQVLCRISHDAYDEATASFAQTAKGFRAFAAGKEFLTKSKESTQESKGKKTKTKAT